MFILLMISLLLIPAMQAQETVLVTMPDQRLGTMSLDALDFSQDGRWLVTGGRDKMVRVWDALTRTNTVMLAGHTDWVTDVHFSHDGTRLISGGQDNSVRVWDPRTYTQVLTLQHHSRAVTGVAFSPDDRLIASGSLDETLWLGDAQTGETVATLPNYGGPVWGVAFNPNGQTLVSGSENGDIWVWGLYNSSLSRLSGHTGPVTALDFNADGTQLASASWDGSIRLWDMTNDALLATMQEHTGPVMGIVFNPTDEGFALASAGLDGTIRLWDEAGKTIAILEGDESPLGDLALSVSEHVLASASINGGLDLWDTQQRIEPLLSSDSFLPVFTPPPPPTQPPVVVQQLPAPTQVASAAQPVSSGGGLALSIPTANIYSPITTFYLDGTTWAIDAWERNVGHLQGTAWIDQPGNIALGGHSEMPDGRPGIFAGLYGVKIGDPIFLGNRRYIVSEITTVNYRDLRVVYPTATDRLTLITCDIPSFDSSSNAYIDRLVVIATPG
ncbi:MAG: sortase [Anaerolineae bacterium]|nr:sortase [Anaerolineae bacterium]